jgi:hypothetical protein
MNLNYILLFFNFNYIYVFSDFFQMNIFIRLNKKIKTINDLVIFCVFG